MPHARVAATTTVVLALMLLVTAASPGRVAERHLVYVRQGGPTVWIADADGRRARPLTRGSAAAVSPDGRTVAVGRRDGIYLVSSDGKRARLLTARLRGPRQWTPDGKRIVTETETSLGVVDVESGRSRVIARGRLYDFSLSPDGRRIVYARARRPTPQVICGDHIDLYAADLAGGTPAQLTRDGRSAFPVWGRTRIAFSRLPRRLHLVDCFAPGIWTMHPDGSDLRAIIARAPAEIAR